MHLRLFSYQEAIEDITRRMGAGMAKFICKEVCHLDFQETFYGPENYPSYESGIYSGCNLV